MIEEIRIGQFVSWIEEPHLEGQIKPSTLIGKQVGEIIRIVKNKKSGSARVCVRNCKDRKMYHWIEAETACDLLSPANA